MGWMDAQRYITGRPNVEIITRARRRYQYHPWRMGVPPFFFTDLAELVLSMRSQ